MKNIYDLIIVGSGPAGLSSAVYAKRAMLNTLVFEKELSSGGQIVSTYEVDNYLGLPGVNGYELSLKFREHADKLGVEFANNNIIDISVENNIKCLTTDKGERFYAKAVIIAGGAVHRKLGVTGEDRLSGMGVSYCATCDGAFFRNKTVAVAGGGDAALEDAVFLAGGCSKVYLIHRRDELRGAKILQQKLMSLDNVEILWNSTVEEIMGEDVVSSIAVNTKGVLRNISVDGIFIAVGTEPLSDAFKGCVATDENGYIIADETGQTSVEGIFAAGDIRTKALRQIITAASDGANCVYSVEKYLAEIIRQ